MSTVEFTELDKYDLFRSDSINVSIYSDTCKSSQLEPEKKLMLAILKDAIECEDKEWILDESESEYLFSFKNICETLGFNPNYLRKGIMVKIAM